MFASHAFEFAVLVLMLAGLAAVVAELLLKQPAALLAIVTDVRAMAQPQTRSRLAAPVMPTAANGNVAAVAQAA